MPYRDNLNPNERFYVLTIMDKETGLWQPVLTSQGELQYFNNADEAYDEAVNANAENFEILAQVGVYYYEKP